MTTLDLYGLGVHSRVTVEGPRTDELLDSGRRDRADDAVLRGADLALQGLDVGGAQGAVLADADPLLDGGVGLRAADAVDDEGAVSGGGASLGARGLLLRSLLLRGLLLRGLLLRGGLGGRGRGNGPAAVGLGQAGLL